MAAPSLNDLKALALALPPSERVMSGEVGDVLSAVIAVGQYGDKIVDAAKEGKIGDFFHDIATDAAAEAGVEAPRRGSVPVEQASTGQAAPSADNTRLHALEQKFDRLLAVLEDKAVQSDPTAPAPVATTPAPDATSPDVVAAADAVADPTNTEASQS